MIDVCLLGSGGSIPNSKRFLSAVLLKTAGKMCLIDCGEGTQVSMKLLGWGFKKIDVICLTHFHGDHIYGLFGLLSTIGNSGRNDSITILGPKGLGKIALCIEALIPNLPFEIIYYENPHTYNFHNLEIQTINLHHSAPCLGYAFYLARQRIFDVNKALLLDIPKYYWNILQKGKEVVYNNQKYTKEMVLGHKRRGIKISIITDTRPTEDIPNFIKGSDLFICEGMYGENEDNEKAQHTKHMTFQEAAMLAKTGEVAEMVLTHFSPSLIEPENSLHNAKAVFENSFLSYDRMIIKLKFK